MALDSLATVDDLNARFALDVDTGRAATLLDDASAAIRAYTGQQFTAATSTHRFKVRHVTLENGGYGSHMARLRQRPVTAVTAAKSVSGLDIPFVWDGEERVYLWTTLYGPSGGWEYGLPRVLHNRVDITYTHGYDQVPDVVVAVCCSMAARALSVPADQGLIQETIGDYSYRRSQPVGGAVGMLPDERAALDVYRRAAGTVRLTR